MVGHECAQQRSNLEVSYPISNGIVKNWEDMHHVWQHTFENVLRVDPTECRILLTDPPLNPTKNREQMVETMFETWGFSGAFIQVQAVLTLYAQGLLTGLVVDSGDGVTHVVSAALVTSPAACTGQVCFCGTKVGSDPSFRPDAADPCGDRACERFC